MTLVIGSKMKIPGKKFFLLFFPLIISCSSSGRFIQLTNDNEKSKLIFPPSKTCFLIVIDSLKVDSSQYGLFSLKKDSNGHIRADSYWRIRSFDSIQQTIEFQNCILDTVMVILRKEQIRYLTCIPGIIISARDAVDIVTIPAFLLGTIGTAWGLISLPFPSTPWQEDLKLIRGGVIALGIFGLALWVSEPAKSDSIDNKYRIDSLH